MHSQSFKKKDGDGKVPLSHKVMHFIVYTPMLILFVWYQYSWLADVWMGTYTPGWLQWAAELPAPIGYVAAGFMIPSFLFVYVVIPADIEGPSENYNTDSFGSILKSILQSLCIFVIGFVCMF